MKSLKELLLSESINESLSREDILAKIKELKTENDKLGDESDDLFGDYCDERGEDSFWELAPTWAQKRNTFIWDTIEKNDAEISKLYKQLNSMK